MKSENVYGIVAVVCCIILAAWSLYNYNVYVLPSIEAEKLLEIERDKEFNAFCLKHGFNQSDYGAASEVSFCEKTEDDTLYRKKARRIDGKWRFVVME